MRAAAATAIRRVKVFRKVSPVSDEIYFGSLCFYWLYTAIPIKSQRKFMIGYPHLSSNAATPGSTSPARNSSVAPPPVEM